MVRNHQDGYPYLNLSLFFFLQKPIFLIDLSMSFRRQREFYGAIRPEVSPTSEEGVLNCHRHTDRHPDRHTDMGTLWLNRPSGADSVKIPQTGNTCPSRMCAIQEYQYYTMSLCLCLCQFRMSMSIPWVIATNMNYCLYHESRKFKLKKILKYKIQKFNFQKYKLQE